MIEQLILLFLKLGTTVALTPHHNVYRGQQFNWQETHSFQITQSTVGQFTSLATETAPSRSFLRCSSECLMNKKCAGIMYDEEQRCHLLNGITGIREQAQESGEVRVILYGIDEAGKFEPSLGGCGDLASPPSFQYPLPPALPVIQYDCLYWYTEGYIWDGIYCINPDGSGAFEAYCDMTKDGGGWTVFQRRVDDSVDFYRNWTSYVAGFGDLERNLWLGLDKLHALTAAYDTELHIYMDTFEEESATAQYGYFNVGNADSKYTLNVGDYSGTAGDSLITIHNERKFSTYDQDNDENGNNCAVTYKGAWWYRSCLSSNLNGQYLAGQHSSAADGVNWGTFKGHRYSLKTTIMKVRRLN